MTEPRNRLRESDLDDAIDRAVRELTSGEPSRRFEQAVLDRIHQRGHGIPWMRFAWAAAAVAAVVIAVVLTRTSAPAPGPIAPSVPQTASAAPKPAPVETPAPALAAEPTRRRPAAVAASRRTLMAAAVTHESTADIAPLQSLEPIAVAPLQSESVVPAPIAIAPLAPIPDVQVAVLSPSIERE